MVLGRGMTWRRTLACGLAALGVLGGLGGATAAAQPSGAEVPSIRVGATIFTDYTVVDTPVARDAFNVTRSYINVSGSVSERISFRVTPDVVRQTDGSTAGSLMFRLKFAYFSVALPRDMSLRAGMQQTPFIDGEESVYRYRFQGLSFAEQDGALASADVGVSWRSPLGRYGDVHVGIFNGEGYNRAEVNGEQALMARVTVRPAPGHAVARGLRLTGYYHADTYVEGAPRNRALGGIWFEHARFNVALDVLRKVDQPLPTAAKVTGEGLSVYVTPFFDRKGRGLEGLLRVDVFDPNVDVAGSQRRLIAGLAYWFPRPGTASAAVLANVEQLSHHGGAPRPTDRKFSLHALVSF